MTVATAEEAAARIWNAEGSSGRALGVLMGVRPGERSLFVGVRGYHNLKDSIPQLDPEAVYADLAEFLDARAPTGPFDLAVVAMGPEARLLERTLARVKTLLSSDGSLLLIAPNRTSLDGFRQKPSHPFQGERYTRRGYRSLLRQMGFGSIAEFLYSPLAKESFELLASDQRLELPAYAPRIDRALNRAGLLAHFHDTLMLVASSDPDRSSRLLSLLAHHLAETGETAPELRLTRAAARPRGSLILFLDDVRSGRRILCRIPLSARAHHAAAKNLEWTRAIHADSRIPARLRSLIPKPLGEIEVGDATAFLETLQPGTIAWKEAVRPRVEARLFPQSCAFLSTLGDVTRHSRTLAVGEMGDLLPVPGHPWFDHEFAGLLASLRSSLLARVSGGVRPFCMTHGDFGYGNLLASADGADLTGVIDWDGGRFDLEGVDLVNFLVQRRRMQGRISLSAAVAEVGRMVIDQEAASLPHPGGKPLPLPSGLAERQELVAWAIWRFAERDTKYAHEYERGRRELATCLRWAITELAP